MQKTAIYVSWSNMPTYDSRTYPSTVPPGVVCATQLFLLTYLLTNVQKFFTEAETDGVKCLKVF